MKLRGLNNKYPAEIQVYLPGQDEVPQWLSDKAKILKLSDTGRPELDMTPTNTGGYQIKSADGSGILVTTQEGGYVCFGDGRIFSLTQRQLGLLYKE